MASKTALFVSIGLASAALAGPTFAHHSFAMFDADPVT